MNHEHRPGNSEVGRMSDQDKRDKQLVPELTLAKTKRGDANHWKSLGRDTTPTCVVCPRSREVT